MNEWLSYASYTIHYDSRCKLYIYSVHSEQEPMCTYVRMYVCTSDVHLNEYVMQYIQLFKSNYNSMMAETIVRCLTASFSCCIQI